MDVGYRFGSPFFYHKMFYTSTTILCICMQCHAICCSYIYICRYKTLHYCSSFRYPVPSKIFCCSIIYLGSYKSCIPKPVPGRNNKHQESDIVTVFYSSTASTYLCLFLCLLFFFFKVRTLNI